MSGTRWGDGGGGDSTAFAKLPPGRHLLSREVVRDHQRQRILRAALQVFGARAAAAATVKDLIRKAQVSRATFYEVFDDKEDCLAALHDELLRWLTEQVVNSVGEAPSWAAAVRAAVTKTVELLSQDSRLAAICAVEAPASRVPPIRLRHERLVAELSERLREGREESPRGGELPEILEPALVYGAIYLVGRSIVYGEGPDAATLARELGELILVSYGD